MLNLKENDSVLKHHIDNGNSIVKLDNKFSKIKINPITYLSLVSDYTYEIDNEFNFTDDKFGGQGQTRFTGTGTIYSATDDQIKFYWWIWFDLDGSPDDETVIYLTKYNPELEIEIISEETDYDEDECEEYIDNWSEFIERAIQNAIITDANLFGYSARQSDVKIADMFFAKCL